MMMKTEIVVGCWVNTPWGPAVAYAVAGNSISYRYVATRQVNDKSAVIWVANGSYPADVSYLGPPDDVSAMVLKLKGPYGED